MKQMIFAILLALSLILLTSISGRAVTDECDQLLYQLSQNDVDTFEENWQPFTEIAAYITPYDLIRVAESNVNNYIALCKSNADPADIEAARQILLSSIRDIRRIHSVSWELIF